MCASVLLDILLYQNLILYKFVRVFVCKNFREYISHTLYQNDCGNN